VRAGRLDETLIDRSVLRVLTQKEELGLFDESFAEPPASIDLDTPAHRETALRLAEESLVLLTNNGVLPLAPRTEPLRIAVVGPNAGSSEALMGCYSFVNHVLAHHPGVELGVSIPSVLEALQDEFPTAAIAHVAGCDVDSDDASGLADAVAAVQSADVAVVVVGDRAGLFGRGTVGEGNDVESLSLPGIQRELVEAATATGTPVVTVVLSGRPYELGWAVSGPTAPDALLQAFFPGEEGGRAIAQVLSGRVAPSGHLPVSLPRSAGAQPFSYLHPKLGGASEITSADSTPVLPFGHGLTYTTFERFDLSVDTEAATSGTFRASVRVRNTGERPGTDLVQLYAHDVFASVTRPVAQLVGYTRVDLAPGEEAIVEFDVPTARLAFTDQQFTRIVEAGRIDLWVGPSCEERNTEAAVTLTGADHHVTAADARLVGVRVEILEADAVGARIPVE
jgi:beta-glucosidase